MKVIVIGGVAGGMAAATRLRRLDESAEIVVIERGPHVSFATCGLPYYVGGVIEERSSLLLQSPAVLAARFALDIRVSTEVVSINRVAKIVTFRERMTGRTGMERYDRIILATGSLAAPLPEDSAPTLSLRTIEDVDAIMAVIDQSEEDLVAVVIGGGFIGLEAVDNLVRRGIHTTLVHRAPQLFAPLDPEMASLVLDEVRAHGVVVHLDTAVVEVSDSAVLLDNGNRITAELVINAGGVHPATELASATGLRLGVTGGIAVDKQHRSSEPTIFAVGDGVEKIDAVDGTATLVTMAGLANRHGRAAADALAGRAQPSLPALGTAIIAVFDKTVATVGWNEKKLVAARRAHRIIHTHPTSHANYYPGAEPMAIKLLVDAATDAILGAQIVGSAGVDKRIDVIATAMSAGLTASALKDLELAYAPPYGSAKDPINLLGYVADNLRSRPDSTVQWHELADQQRTGALLVDVRSPAEFTTGHILGAVNIPLEQLRQRHTELGNAAVIVHCQVGQRGHTAARMLAQLGHRVRNLDGGYATWRAGMAASAVRTPGN
ncbi:MAG: FAD-dependent oxidoreductase [Rhodoglobus sp.]